MLAYRGWWRTVSEVPVVRSFSSALTLALLASTVMVAAVADAGDADAAKSEGDRLAAAGDLVGAVRAYERSLEVDSSQPLVLNELGTVLFRLDRMDEAIERFELAVGLDRDYAIGWFNLAFAASRAGRWSDAIRAYRRHTELRPDEPDAWYGLARALERAGRNMEASEALEIYADTESRPARAERASTARERAAELREMARRRRGVPPVEAPAVADGDTAVSGVDGAKALEAAEIEPAARAEVAVDHHEDAKEALPPESAHQARGEEDVAPEIVVAGHDEHAEEDPEIEGVAGHGEPASKSPSAGSPEAAADDGDSIADLIAEGDVAFQAGRIDEAAAAFSAVLEQDPGNLEAAYKLAFVHASLGRYEDARLGWRRVLSLDSENQGARHNLALVEAHIRSERVREREELAAEAERRARAKESARELFREGIQLVRQELHEDALETFGEALERDPELVQGLLGRGSVLIALERFDEALRDFEAAHDARPDLAAPLFSLGEAHRAMGNEEQARELYLRYLRSEGRDVDARLKEQARARLR